MPKECKGSQIVRYWHRLRGDLEFYCNVNLKILTKEGELKQLKFNKAQIHLHQLVEEQKKKTGKIRAVILKGRQQGCSTYISARLFHNVTNNKGKQAFIMAHDSDATSNLFAMSQRYLTYSSPHLIPSCSQRSQNKLTFDRLNSGYSIKTARTGSAGRSKTVQLVHGSECAFWPTSSDIGSGLLQSVPRSNGTEIFLESTSYGVGNFFHNQWELAEAGISEFIPVFIPWYWQEEYQIKPRANFTLTDEEIELKELYKVDNTHLQWRRIKISELGQDGTSGEWAFKREYPFSAFAAFEVNTTDAFILHSTVIRATLAKSVPNANAELILGVDVGGFGDDSTALIFRQGNKSFGLKYFEKKSNMEIAGIIKKTLDTYEQVTRVYIDLGGGAGVYDRLKELGYAHRVFGINFGSKSDNYKYKNKRAEMWGNLRQWLFDGDAQIPNEKKLIKDLTTLRYTYMSDSSIVLEKKEDMKVRLKRSPDAGDALALTFAGTYYDVSKVTEGLEDINWTLNRF